MALLRLSKQRQKTTAVAAKTWSKLAKLRKVPVIKTKAYKKHKKNLMCLFVESWVHKALIRQMLVDFRLVIELVSQEIVDWLGLITHKMNEK